jgi:undecaprenyl phosphate N,N'-diacetylbacillosamine 1-phosphate transferase
MYKLLLKRIIDLTLALLGLIILFIPFAVIFIIQLCVFDGKAFFIQYRTGLNAKKFRILKFRSMFEKDHNSSLKEEDRIGKWGAFLRNTSLDEIPQLFNVLAGDLSLVGPRPLLPEYLPFYSAYQLKRLLVKPGMTGLAQIKGRNKLSWRHKFRYDVFYVSRHNLLLDLKIIMLTVFKLIFQKTEVQKIPEKFTGSN